MNKILNFEFLVLIDTDSTVDLATNGAMWILQLINFTANFHILISLD